MEKEFELIYKDPKYRSARVVNGLSMAGPRAHLRGMGLVRIALVSSIVELVCKIGISVTLSQVIGSAGIWIAAPSGWVLGLIPSLIYLLRWFKHAPADGELPAGKAPAAP